MSTDTDILHKLISIKKGSMLGLVGMVDEIKGSGIEVNDNYHYTSLPYGLPW